MVMLPRAFCAFEIGFENVKGEDGLISFGSCFEFDYSIQVVLGQIALVKRPIWCEIDDYSGLETFGN